MKKKLLFVMPSLSAGGGEKSLVNLLSQINFDLYSVDLFLFNKEGVFLYSIPKEVNLLDYPINYKVFTKPYIKSVQEFFLKKQMPLLTHRILFSIKSKLILNRSISEQYTWKHISKSLDKLEGVYDVAISFLEKASLYFIVDKVKAKKKIGWIHTNYSCSGMKKKIDAPYFNELDYLVTVSEECAEALKKEFSNIKEKVKIIHNIISPEMITKMSLQVVGDEDVFDPSYINILSISRLSKEKGIDLAIQSCKRLKDKGYKIRWVVLGDGVEKSNLERMVMKLGLKEDFRLLGIKDNPYPYLKKATIYVQPSRYEGKSIALDEAKVLNKPIVVTNYLTVKDQIQYGFNGLIAETNPLGISQEIEKLIKDKCLRNTLILNLSNCYHGTEIEIKKLYNLIG
jgi:glycosyltransferase involved in cell wall biosynthesis